MSTPQRQFSPEELKALKLLAEKMEEVSISNWYEGRLVVAAFDGEDDIVAWVHVRGASNTVAVTFEAPEFLMEDLLYEDEEETSAEEPK